jgi:predicted AAA+ superfamily ATPase
LFTYIKIYVDTYKQDGLFWLTGSQKFHLMQGIQESLAGRVAILDMLGFSQKEIHGQARDSVPFLPSPDWINRKDEKDMTALEVYQMIWEGSFPKIRTNPIRIGKLFINHTSKPISNGMLRTFTALPMNWRFITFYASPPPGPAISLTTTILPGMPGLM